MSYKIKHLSPMMPNDDSKASIEFLKNFDFELKMDADNYFILEKDGQTLHLMEIEESDWMGQQSLYVEVENLESAWKKIEPLKDKLDVREPFDTGYNMKEFHVVIPKTGTLLFVGQRT